MAWVLKGFMVYINNAHCVAEASIESLFMCEVTGHVSLTPRGISVEVPNLVEC